MKADKIRETIKKLQRLVEDQKGTPEGDLAQQIIDRIKEKYPDLDIISTVYTQWESTFKHEFEFQLWLMACQAHDIKLAKVDVDNPLHFISEGDEVDMTIARYEWEFSSYQFKEMSEQVLRGIINKLWPTICKAPEDIPNYQESPYRSFAEMARDKTILPRKALTQGGV